MSSSDIGVSPAARPQSGTHLLFIGRGTSSFCNYWAKAICDLVYGALSREPIKQFQSIEEVTGAINQNPSSTATSARLAIYHVIFGTLIGFGEVVQPPEYRALRGELLGAMETFVVAHEYAHFVAEERIPKFQGQLNIETSHELEMFCDELGLKICREIGNQNDSFFEFTGVGAVIFLRTVELCRAVKAEVERFEARIGLRESNDSHPETTDRINAIKNHIRDKTALDQKEVVGNFVEEYDCILSALTKRVVAITIAAMEDKTSVGCD